MMTTVQRVQRWKAQQRKALLRKHAQGKVRIEDFTLAAANTIKRQKLDVSGVEVLENEIHPYD